MTLNRSKNVFICKNNTVEL